MRSIGMFIRGLLFTALITGPVVGAEKSLPFYDVRANDAATAARVHRAVFTSRTAAERTAIEQARARLKAEIPGICIDEHEFLGTPHWVASTERFLTAPAAGAPRQVIRQYVVDHQKLFEFNPAELDAARTSWEYVSDHNGVAHLTLQQQIGQIDLYGCEVLANVSRNGELINISSTILPRPASGFQVAAAKLNALDAIRAAAANVGIKMNSDPTAKTTPVGVTQKQTWKNTPDFRADEPITSELLYFPLTRTDIRPAWLVLIPQIGIGNTYEMMIDATNGDVLRRFNRLHFATTEAMTFRVYTSDSPSPGTPGTSTPTGAQFPFVQRQLVTVNPGDISAIDPNGWMDDGTSTSAGNNVHVHLDTGNTNPTNTGAIAGSSYRTFDFPLEPATPPYDITVAPSDANARNASITQLFYLGNRYHDVLWSLGFKEANKNFQNNNFGLGGTGNDRIQEDCQDGSGTNNSNFNTGGGDGSTARCQMYIFTGPTPDRDGSLDADVVYHEHSHGLSIRLSNGTVNGEQSGGMGEGWGDFFAATINAEPGDDPHGVYPMGGFVTYQLSGMTTNYYFGIRRFPYCTDMNKNPTTYADIDPGQLSFPAAVPKSPIIDSTPASANEVHNVGDVWCNVLLECRANLWDALGFSGNQLMMQLVVDGLKLQGTNPNLLQARDGILQADLADNGGVNRGYLWKAFAKRGMGPQATSPAGGTSASGVHESFTLLQFVYPSGIPSQLAPGVTTTFPVNVNSLATGVTATSGSGQLYYSVNGGSFTQVAMTSTGTNTYNATLPALNCFDRVRFYVSSDSNIGTFADPEVAPVSFQQATVLSSSTTIFADDAEVARGWTMGVAGDTATTGMWTRVNPVGTAAQPEDAHSPVTCFVTGQGVVGGGLGDNDVDNGFTTLLSPAIDCSGHTDTIISYWRWYSNVTGAAPDTDTFRVDVSNNNGGSWTNAETLGTTFGGDHTGGWFYHEFHIKDFFATPSNQVRVRFVAEDNPSDGSGSLVEAAVDDFNSVGIDCTPPVVCTRGDVNNDGFIDGLDVVRFIEIEVGGGGTAMENCAGDLGSPSNGIIDGTDMQNFINCILSGGSC